MSPKTRFQILLEPDQLDALRRIQEDTGAPVSEQIRRSVERWIAENGGKKKTAHRRATSRRKA